MNFVKYVTIFCLTSLFAVENREVARGGLECVIKKMFAEERATVLIDEGDNVTIENFSRVSRLRNALEKYIHSVYPWVKEITFSNQEKRKGCQIFPASALFPPIIPNPFEVSQYIYGEKINGDRLNEWDFNFSMACGVPFVEVYDVFQKGSAFQIGLQADIQGIVEETMRLYDLNVGVPLVYAYGKFATRLRYFHFCSHMSNRLTQHLRDHGKKVPCTIFFENLDLTLSCDVTSLLRLYAGAGVVLHGRLIRNQEKNYPNGFIGFDKRFSWKYLPSQDFFRTYYMALDVAFWPWLNYSPSVAGVMGLRFAKVPDVGFQFLINFRYQNGYGPGNFKSDRTSSYAIGVQGVY